MTILVVEILNMMKRLTQRMLECAKVRVYHQDFFFSLRNDLVEFISSVFDGLSDITDTIYLLCDNDDIEVYFKLYLLLYANDTSQLFWTRCFF